MADYLNVMVGPNVLPTDKTLLFPENEEVYVASEEEDIYDILIKLGAFDSRSQAKKNWKSTDGPDLPDGWSEFFVGKKRRWLCIWNPTW